MKKVVLRRLEPGERLKVWAAVEAGSSGNVKVSEFEPEKGFLR